MTLRRLSDECERSGCADEVTDPAAYRNDYGARISPWEGLILPVLKDIGAARIVAHGIALPPPTAHSTSRDDRAAPTASDSKPRQSCSPANASPNGNSPFSRPRLKSSRPTPATEAAARAIGGQPSLAGCRKAFGVGDWEPPSATSAFGIGREARGQDPPAERPYGPAWFRGADPNLECGKRFNSNRDGGPLLCTGAAGGAGAERCLPFRPAVARGARSARPEEPTGHQGILIDPVGSRCAMVSVADNQIVPDPTHQEDWRYGNALLDLL